MKKYKVWWMVNFIRPSFEIAVSSPLHGFVAIETFAALDLGKPEYIKDVLKEIKEQTGKDFSGYSETIGRDYMTYRRSHSINAAFLIDSNVSDFLEYDEVEKDWCTWYDEETGSDLKQLIDEFRDESKEWATYLNQMTANP